MEPYLYFPGTVPVVVNIPHCGTHVPEAILERFNERAKQLPDTDWHVDRLYSFAKALGVHMLVATHSRYVVDLNRAPDGGSLYPGRFTTGLCPITFFDGMRLYDGEAPDEAEIQDRIQTYWQPYHAKLTELTRSLSSAGKKMVLFDAHSICSRVPALFEGRLPDLNLGTADGVTADRGLVEKLVQQCAKSGYSHVLNGRFKGGHITRFYGRPDHHIHAVQLELAQINYMNEDAPYTYDETRAKQLQATLSRLLSIIVEWSGG